MHITADAFCGQHDLISMMSIDSFHREKTIMDRSVSVDATRAYQGAYKVVAKAPAQVLTGSWYFGFDCRACGKRFAVFDDPSSGEKKIQYQGGGHYRVACGHCAAVCFYGTDQISRYQAT
jgi:hypothetical protein